MAKTSILRKHHIRASEQSAVFKINGNTLVYINMWIGFSVHVIQKNIF